VIWTIPLVINQMSYNCTLSLTFQVSLGSAATDLRWGENFNIPQFIVVGLYSSENITKIGQYLPELSQNKRVSFFMAHSVYSWNVENSRSPNCDVIEKPRDTICQR